MVDLISDIKQTLAGFEDHNQYLFRFYYVPEQRLSTRFYPCAISLSFYFWLYLMRLNMIEIHGIIWMTRHNTLVFDLDMKRFTYSFSPSSNVYDAAIAKIVPS